MLYGFPVVIPDSYEPSVAVLSVPLGICSFFGRKCYGAFVAECAGRKVRLLQAIAGRLVAEGASGDLTGGGPIAMRGIDRRDEFEGDKGGGLLFGGLEVDPAVEPH